MEPRSSLQASFADFGEPPLLMLSKGNPIKAKVNLSLACHFLSEHFQRSLVSVLNSQLSFFFFVWEIEIQQYFLIFVLFWTLLLNQKLHIQLLNSTYFKKSESQLSETHHKGEKFAILPGNPNHPATFLQNKFINKTEKWIAFLYTHTL